MNELQTFAVAVANVVAGGLGYAVMQFLKWVLEQYGIALEGRLAANVTMALSGLLGILSTVIAFTSLQLPWPVEWRGWVGLITEIILATLGAATIVYKNIQVKK